jgi:hypothetical protein
LGQLFFFSVRATFFLCRVWFFDQSIDFSLLYLCTTSFHFPSSFYFFKSSDEELAMALSLSDQANATSLVSHDFSFCALFDGGLLD